MLHATKSDFHLNKHFIAKFIYRNNKLQILRMSENSTNFWDRLVFMFYVTILTHGHKWKVFKVHIFVTYYVTRNMVLHI